MGQIEPIQRVLVLYHHPVAKDAPTIKEHVNSFHNYSRFRVWQINTESGFPFGLDKFKFQIIVLHYSLIPYDSYHFNDRFVRYLEQNKSAYKIAFFQDEYHNCQRRFDILNQFHIDCVYTLVEPQYFKDVYQKYTSVPKLIPGLTGYVSDDLIRQAQKFAKPDKLRTIDIGYRGRQLPFYMGKGSQEKQEIAVRFLEHAKGLGMNLNIESEEKKRLYGNRWYKFLGNCKGCLGVEAGVSIFDLDGAIQREYERLIAEKPEITFEEMSEKLLNRYEGNIPYRTISPRHFEAAAFRICQILYEGEYQGILKPMVHYIPLKKDFSNFNEVIQMFRDEQFRRQLTDNCYRDLIASGQYSYRKFIEEFDRELSSAGLTPPIAREQTTLLSIYLNLFRVYRWFVRMVRMPLDSRYPGKETLFFLGRPVYRICLRVRKSLQTFLADRFQKEK
jgi:hypothetical protein